MYALCSQHSIKNPFGVLLYYVFFPTYCLLLYYSSQFTDTKMDVKNMSDFESGSFDAVIDKGIMPCNFRQHYVTSLHVYATWC